MPRNQNEYSRINLRPKRCTHIHLHLRPCRRSPKTHQNHRCPFTAARLRRTRCTVRLRTRNITEVAAMVYDDVVAGCYSRLLGTTVTRATAELWVPSRLGGWGAMSAQTRGAPSAWAAWSAIASEIADECGAPSIDDMLARAHEINNHIIRNLHDRISELGAPLKICSVTHAR